MDSVLRAAAVYFFLLLIFRVAGKRTLAEVTTFDAVLLLIFSEAIQQALIDGDQSMTNAFLIVVTLLGLDIAISLLTMRSSKMDKALNDVPLVIVQHGRPLEDRMRKARVTPDDVLERGRELWGIRAMEQVEYAIVERTGAISILPRRLDWAGTPERRSAPAS